MIYSFISSEPIIAHVYERARIDDENAIIFFKEYIPEALDLIGGWNVLEHKNIRPEVVNREIEIPYGLKFIQGIYGNGELLRHLSGSFDYYENTESEPLKTKNQLGYTIRNRFIRFNYDATDIEIAYDCWPMDENDYPLIPDSIHYKKALFFYILKEYYFPEWLNGKFPDHKYQKLEYEWEWYCGAAGTEAIIPDIDTLEKIKDSWLRLKQDVNQYKAAWQFLGEPEMFIR